VKHSLANRLSALYATLLGFTVLLVIVATGVALVWVLANFERDIVIAKHEEARILTEQYKLQGLSLAQAAPGIVTQLSGIGLNVAVYDDQGHFLAGDRTLRPPILDQIVKGNLHFEPPDQRLGMPLEDLHAAGSPLPPPPGAPHAPAILEREARPEAIPLTAVDGGYVAFAPSIGLLFVSLLPYWRVVLTIAIVAIAVSLLLGRVFAQHALRPILDLTTSLRALADGDFTQRQFIAPGGDEIGALTAAYNDAAANVAAVMNERRETEERMRQFVADAGHELRTPLTVIGGYIDVLRRGAIAEPAIARQILGTMAIEKEHMRGLIERLMRLARLDADTPPYKEPIDVSDLLRSQVEAARRLDETRHVDYSVEGATSVVADRAEIGEALWNIVENALKYAPDSPIHLRASRTNGTTTISVADQGPGMTESERLHAFERFYRGDQRGEITGSGLGLAIAKRAVERAGGSIALESAPNRGTVVTITLS
jgi:two-component system OmpR family sensor kinase